MSEQPVAPVSQFGTSKAGGKLLLVDDNPLNRDRLAVRLRGCGFTVAAVEGGHEALRRLGREAFDLVLLDSMMPGFGGVDVLSELKSRPELKEIPVIMISGLDEIESVARCIELGAEDYLSSPFDPVLLTARLDACLENKRLREQQVMFTEQLQREKDHADHLVNVVIPIGISLMKEPHFDRLLEKILVEAKQLCHADGGTLYLRTGDEHLKFVMLRNDTLNISMGGPDNAPIPFAPLDLFDRETREPNHSQVACHVALTGKSVNIPDAYDAAGFDFHGTKQFDDKMGYRSCSFLTVPLKNDRSVTGVLQLINAIDQETKKVVPFEGSLQQSVESLAVLASAALESYKEE